MERSWEVHIWGRRCSDGGTCLACLIFILIVYRIWLCSLCSDGAWTIVAHLVLLLCTLLFLGSFLRSRGRCDDVTIWPRFAPYYSVLSWEQLHVIGPDSLPQWLPDVASTPKCSDSPHLHPSPTQGRLDRLPYVGTVNPCTFHVDTYYLQKREIENISIQILHLKGSSYYTSLFYFLCTSTHLYPPPENTA